MTDKDTTEVTDDPVMLALTEEYESLHPLAADDEDRAAVERYLEMKARRQDKAARIRLWADDQIARLAAEEARIDSFYGPPARRATERIVAAQKKRSLSTPWGVVGFRRRTQARVDIPDEEMVLQWCKENWPQAVGLAEPRAKLSKTELLLAYQAGKHPPVEIVEPSDEFYVKMTPFEEPDDGADTRTDTEDHG